MTICLLRPKKKSEKAVKLKLKKDLNSISKSWKSRKKIEKERKEIQERKSKEEITKKEVGSMTKSSRKMKTIRMKQDKARGSMRTGTRYTHTHPMYLYLHLCIHTSVYIYIYTHTFHSQPYDQKLNYSNQRTLRRARQGQQDSQKARSGSDKWPNGFQA